MTIKEAKKIVEIMETADGECPYCVIPLLDQLTKAFPELDIKSLHSIDWNEEL